MLFLTTIGAIAHPREMAYLSYRDLVGMRNDPGFKVFVAHYRQLARDSANLADLYVSHDAEVRQRYFGLSLASVILLAAFINSSQPGWLFPEGNNMQVFLEAVSSAADFVGRAGFVTYAAKGLLFDSKMHDSERTADSILRKAEAAAWPLSYAAELVAKAVRENA